MQARSSLLTWASSSVVECLICNEEVRGPIPRWSTNYFYGNNAPYKKPSRAYRCACKKGPEENGAGRVRSGGHHYRRDNVRGTRKKHRSGGLVPARSRTEEGRPRSARIQEFARPFHT